MTLYVWFAAFADLREDGARNNSVSKPLDLQFDRRVPRERQIAADGPPETLCGFVPLWLHFRE